METVMTVTRTFDEKNVHWDPKTNFIFLKTMESFANDKLRDQGYLTLNEVFEMLGFSKKEDGALAGWTADSRTWIDFEIHIPEGSRTCDLTFNLTTHNVFRTIENKDSN